MAHFFLLLLGHNNHEILRNQDSSFENIFPIYHPPFHYQIEEYLIRYVCFYISVAVQFENRVSFLNNKTTIVDSSYSIVFHW